MSARIDAALPEGRGRFVQALALGDTRALADEDWDVLRANGLTHLIAISGFHVGLVAGLFALVARGVWWAWPALGRRLPRPIAAAVGAAC
ncbi:UNVERIFIED_CONTAM: ComEC/Rec2 family competence protein, partial [Salmonella enterica subsp. enterica serovar Weltevreden]